MDFHSLPRRDLQSLCKKNKIPANMTNVAMADALKALEIVEGLEEYLKQTESTAPPSPTSVAKKLPNTARAASRTTRRTTAKDATQTSHSVTRACRTTRKSLTEEMDQENRNMNVMQSPAVPASRRRAATSVAQNLETNDGKPEADVKLEANVPKTPAARSTRKKAPLPVSETKKDESVQKVYSTRRSVRFLEKCMADLSLKPTEDLDKTLEEDDADKETAAEEKNPEKESAVEEKDPEKERSVEEKDPEKESAVEEKDPEKESAVEEKDPEKGSAVEEKDPEGNAGFEFQDSERTEETEIPGRDLSATLEKEWDMRHENVEDDNNNTDIVDISVSKEAKSETYTEMNELDVNQGFDSDETEAEEKESIDVQAFDSSLQVESNETPLPDYAISPVACKDILDSEIENELAFNGKDDVNETIMEETIGEDDTLSINTNKDSIYESGSESEQSNTESDDSEFESEQSDTEEDPKKDDSSVNDATVNKVELDSNNIVASESDESEEEEDPKEDNLSDADSNTAVFGSDVAVRDVDEEFDESESEEHKNLNLNKTEVTVSTMIPTMISPIEAGSISSLFPRPSIPTTVTNSAMKLSIVANNDDKNKENVESYNGIKAEMGKKKMIIDEESLKGVSLRQLTKMVKELSIKSNNRTALQALPDNN